MVSKMNVSEIIKMPHLDDDQINKAAARSEKLTNILKYAQDIGMEVSVIRIPPAALHVQVGGLVGNANGKRF